MATDRNAVGVQCAAVTREIYSVLRGFLALLYQADGMGNLYHVQIDGMIDQNVRVPWQDRMKSSRLSKGQRSLVRGWLLRKSASKAPLIYNPATRRWYLDLENFPDLAHAAEWLRVNQLTAESYLALWRHQGQAEREQRQRNKDHD